MTKLRGVWLSALWIAAAGISACRSQAPSKPLGELTAITGDVVHESSAKSTTLHAISHEPLFPRDGVTVSASGEAAILSGRTVQRLGPGTQLRIPSDAGSKLVEVVELISGLATFLVDPAGDGSAKFQVRARGAVLTVKGTLFKVDASGTDLALEVLSGTVSLQAGATTKDVTAGQRAMVHGEQVSVSPLDAKAAAATQDDFMSFRLKTTAMGGVITTY